MSRDAITTFLRDRRGTVTTEFVIIFPLIVLILFLIVFVSLFIAATSDVQQLAHELARASFRFIPEAPEDLCARLRQAGLVEALGRDVLFLNPDKLVLHDCPGQPDAAGVIRLTVSYDFVGDYIQSLGRSLGLDIGTITRVSATRY